MQLLGLLDRGRLGQGDEENLGLVGVLEAHQWSGVPRPVAHLPSDLAVVGAGRIEQQQGVPGGRGVEDDEPPAGLEHHVRELLEDGDLVGAGRLQVLGERGPAGVVQRGALACHDPFPVLGDGVCGVDAGDREVLVLAVEGVGQVGRRIGRRQQHVIAPVRQLERDGGGDGRLADAALAHAHDQRRPGCLEAVDEGAQVDESLGRHGWVVVVGGVRKRCVGRFQQRLQCRHTDGVERHQGGRGLWERSQVGWHPRECSRFPGPDGTRERVSGVHGGHATVEDEVGVAHPDPKQLGVGAGGLVESGPLGATDDDQTGAGGVGQGVQGSAVVVSEPVQARDRAEARDVALAVGEVGGPLAGQLKEPDRVAGGGGVEQDVVVASGHVRVREEGGELAEGRDLGGARTRQLFGHGVHLVGRQLGAHGVDDPGPVGIGSLLRIDLQSRQAGDVWDRRARVADRETEDLSDVGCRVGAHEQDPRASGREPHGARAGQGRLSDATLAGEEEKPWRCLEERQPGQGFVNPRGLLHAGQFHRACLSHRSIVRTGHRVTRSL